MKKVGVYQLIHEIGRGSYGTVYEARKDNSNDKFAIKMIPIVNMEQRQLDLIQMEVDLLQKMDHPNIIKLYESKRTKNNFYLVFENCEKGDLQKYLKKYCEVPLQQDTIQKLIYNISDAIQALHFKSIAHRDIKLANILLTRDFVVKLSDFGFAKYANDNALMETYCGTPMTMAPQILLRRHYSLKCDIWSLGVITFQLVYGKLPFVPSGGKGLLDLIEVIQNTQQVIFPPIPVTSQSFKSLIRGALQKDPQKRISIQQFISNQWVQEGKLNNNTSCQCLRSISSALDLVQADSPLIQTSFKCQKDQKMVAKWIYINIQSQLKKIDQTLKQIKNSCKTHIQPDLFQSIIKYLYYRLVRDIKETSIKIMYKQDTLQFFIKDIPQLNNVLQDQKQTQFIRPFIKTIQLLQFISQNKKYYTKQQSIEDYKTILKIFPLFKRFSISISIITTSSSPINSLRLKAVKKWLLQGQFVDGPMNGVTLNTQYTEKNQQIAKKVLGLKQLLFMRIKDMENKKVH